MSIIVKVQDLVKYYGSGENLVKAVNHTNLDIEHGKFTAIVGRSGSGKSTLLHMIGGLDRPDSGKVFIGKTDIFALKEDRLAPFRRKKIPSLNVWENIVLPLGLDGKKVPESEIEELLIQLGLQDKRRAMPATLSGGQKQRAAIARAVAANPAIICADEPTGNLDSQSELEVINLMKKCVTDYGQTLVMITHDEGIAQMADYMVVIEDGKVVSQS